MSDMPARYDADVMNELHEILVHYPPLNTDRQHIQVTVDNGAAVFTGHVKSAISRRYLSERAAEVRGVTAVRVDALYDEDTIRVEAAGRVPEGVLVNVRYGVVILTGAPPDETSIDAMVQQVATVPGVERVIVSFDEAE